MKFVSLTSAQIPVDNSEIPPHREEINPRYTPSYRETVRKKQTKQRNNP